MRRARLLGVLVGLAALVLAVEPALAQTSANEELITGLNLKLLYVAVPITVLVEGILIYTVYRFKNAEGASPTQENRRLEITWTVATAIILLFVGLASYQVLGSAFIGGATATGQPAQLDYLSQDYGGAVAPEDPSAVEVEVNAQRYNWVFKYPHENISQRSSPQQAMVIPANTTVYLHVTSLDWLHAVHVPDLGWKQDAFPGQYNTLVTEVYEPGSYQLYCAEYCGVGHSNMLAKVTVLPRAEDPDDPAPGTWEAFLQEQGASASGSMDVGATNPTGLGPAPVAG
jgi:cytochrome c oxidase subunit 2